MLAHDCNSCWTSVKVLSGVFAVRRFATMLGYCLHLFMSPFVRLILGQVRHFDRAAQRTVRAARGPNFCHH